MTEDELKTHIATVQKYFPSWDNLPIEYKKKATKFIRKHHDNNFPKTEVDAELEKQLTAADEFERIQKFDKNAKLKFQIEYYKFLQAKKISVKKNEKDNPTLFSDYNGFMEKKLSNEQKLVCFTQTELSTTLSSELTQQKNRRKIAEFKYEDVDFSIHAYYEDAIENENSTTGNLCFELCVGKESSTDKAVITIYDTHLTINEMDLYSSGGDQQGKGIGSKMHTIIAEIGLLLERKTIELQAEYESAAFHYKNGFRYGASDYELNQALLKSLEAISDLEITSELRVDIVDFLNAQTPSENSENLDKYQDILRKFNSLAQEVKEEVKEEKTLAVGWALLIGAVATLLVVPMVLFLIGAAIIYLKEKKSGKTESVPKELTQTTETDQTISEEKIRKSDSKDLYAFKNQTTPKNPSSFGDCLTKSFTFGHCKLKK